MDIVINLDKPNNHTFMPGETVAGHIAIKTEKDIAMSALTLCFHGKGYVSYNNSTSKSGTIESNNSQQRQQPDSFSNKSICYNCFPKYTKEYKNHEVYFNSIQVLPLEPNMDAAVFQNFIQLPADYQSNVPFSFQLPNDIPSSCNLEYGGVNYYCEVSVNIKDPNLSTNETTTIVEKELLVAGILDLDHVENAFIPIHLQELKRFYECFLSYLCLGSGEGVFEMDLGLMKSGYCPGELLEFALDFSNTSNYALVEINAGLDQIIRFVTFGKDRIITSRISSAVYYGDPVSNGNGSWHTSLEIPSDTYLTDLGGCRIVRVEYIFTIEAMFSYYEGCKINLPITVGSVLNAMR